MHAPQPPSDLEVTLGAALRALPLEAPETSAWPALAAAAAERAGATQARRDSRFAWAAAAAVAALAVAIFWIVPRDADDGDQPTIRAVAEPTADDADARLVADLIARNQALERALREDGGGWAVDADYAMAAAQVEELIAAVDGQLAASDAPREAEVLWRVRLALLQELATLRSGGEESLLAGVHGVIAVPADVEIH